MKKILILTICLFAAFGLTAQERDVSLQRNFGTLYGTLRTPEGGSDVVALFIAGSGPTDRNCNSRGAGLYTNSFLYLAQALEKQGIASLRYDKRGIAASRYNDPKKMYDVLFEDYISDAAAWVAWLREEGFRKVVIVGHSEGSLIALCVGADKGCTERALEAATTDAEKSAVESGEAPKSSAGTETTVENAPPQTDLQTKTAGNYAIDGIVSLAGAGFPLDEVLQMQLAAQLATTDMGLLMKAMSVLGSLRRGNTVEDYPRELESLFTPYLQRYWISELRYAPQQLIRQVRVPVLIVNGDNDVQISVANAEALKKASPQSELLIIKGMTHVLKQSEGRDAQAQMAAYMDGDLPLDATLAEAVPRFILSL